ncbi:hypothetical protein BD309DRAFT_944311 [Dichomitus squalens]|uniref:Uncharacterized protein n=1 Tax=Dichomitus squalens TaxID=114155 RepID=A0A4Q9QDV5_9APHY|nr:uncharacterized protein DICSQDRAFT_49924 [Dichomitus squalens LYAD-421 SS1]EJF65716.1 hypothetical protein DICSQDRAFT_49924 [Dichomitus squalens LYAD-421 SS1]TBU50609.1 hypothetical protein BD309DRAFT_944311 [Dichomitus squalens]TBU66002.1 hypothetical protein BD310DRAFT_912523 [Dichomitus squalens]
MSKKPNAIIFGGLNTCSRTLATLLVPPDGGERLVENLRIVDKYSVAPATTYLGSVFPQVLKQPNVEYRQANLTVAATVAAAFDPPAGQDPYDYVFDFTGEIGWDRPEGIQVGHTFKIARQIGLEAAKRQVKAYVRIQHPFYNCKESGNHDEKAEVKPEGVVGTWWHETLRALGAIEDLNLVIIRTALPYGPYINYLAVIPFIAVAACYGHLHQPMKALNSPGKYPSHTVHVEDIAGAMWAAAEWMAKTGRKEGDALAGEEIVFKNEKSKASEVEGVVAPTQKVVAPLFNIEDESKVTLVELGNVIASFFGTTFDFHNFVTNMAAKLRLEDMIEDINEVHVSTWTEMITSSNPPIPNTQFSSYMDLSALKKHVVAFNADKIKEVIGYKLNWPQFNHDAIRDMVDKLKAEHSWPNNS